MNQTWKIILAVIIMTIVMTGGIYYWQNLRVNLSLRRYQQENNELQKELTQLQGRYETLGSNKSNTNGANSVVYNLVNNRCFIDECLFNVSNSNYPLGSAVIKGYYSPVERSAWDETKKCDSFTITGGSDNLIRAMVDLVDSGNTIHSKNDLNQPVINLGLDLLSQREKQGIFKSNNDNQIELIVFNDSPRGVGVPVCYRDVVVLREK